MLDAIKKNFPQTLTNNCLHTLTDLKFHIHDTDEKRCEIQTDPEGIIHFTVENPAAQDIHFLAIDKCLLFDQDGHKRCDCAVFDSTTFCFIEIKTTISGKERRLNTIRKKATEQLKATIELFKKDSLLDKLFVEAYISIITNFEEIDKSVIEESTLIPIPKTRASITEKIVAFDEMGVELRFESTKHFA